MRKYSNWRKCKNLVYKIYPSSYREKFIKICWYCLGESFFPYRLLHCSVPSENNWLPASGRGQYRSSGCDLICYFTNTWFPAKPTRAFFIIYINKRGTYLVVSPACRIVDTLLNSCYYFQGNCFVKAFSTDMCWK